MTNPAHLNLPLVASAEPEMTRADMIARVAALGLSDADLEDIFGADR